MPTYERTNARLSSPVNLRARFHKDGSFFDPYEIDRVEIWKGAETKKGGGVLVDSIDGMNAIQDSPGHYRVIWDPYVECSPALSPGPSGTVQGPGSPGQDPTDPAAVTANTLYFDKWWYRIDPNCALVDTVGLQFFLYPDNVFVDSNFDKFRFEMKPDRKLIVKGEKLDIRLRVIPLPLYTAARQPIVDYLLPITQMRARLLDSQNNEIHPFQDITFTGVDGIYETDQLSAQIIGAYLLQVELVLPNGRSIRYQKIPLQVID